MKNRRKVKVALIIFLLIGISTNSVFGTVTITDINTTTDESDLEINFLGNWIRANNITIDENISVDNLTVSGDTHIENTYIDGIMVMGSDGFLVSPTDTGASIRFNITRGGDIYTQGTWTNDGNIRQSGEYWLYNTIGLLYPHVHMGENGIEVYDGTVAENVVVNLTNAGDITATGNITADNVWLPVYLFTHTNSSQQVIVAGTWLNILFNEDSAINQSITHNHADATNHTFTTQVDGIYRINYHISYHSIVNELARSSSRLLLNDIEIQGSVMDKTSYKGHNTTSLSNTIIVSCNASDEIVAQFTSSSTNIHLCSHGFYGNHPDSATIAINRIG